VSGAEAHELSTDTELTGHVRMGFEEVAEVAHKLRARPGAKPGLLGLGVSFGVSGGGGGLLGAADAAALTPETYQALARGFATHDDARGSVAYSRLPHALAAAGLPVAPHALELPLGASLEQAGARLELRGFMQLATTLLALQPAPRHHHTEHGEAAVVTVQELVLAAPLPLPPGTACLPLTLTLP